jgi:hypothetical protein
MDRHVANREVRIGIDNHVEAQVLSGLEAGERVVLKRRVAP